MHIHFTGPLRPELEKFTMSINVNTSMAKTVLNLLKSMKVVQSCGRNFSEANYNVFMVHRV